MINKNSPIPIYHQLEEYIKQLIDSGQLVPGDILPSEREYSDKYGISRMTIRQAIINLVNERYLYRVKGKGTFVMEKKFEQDLQGLTSFTEDMKARGMKASSKLIKFKIIPAHLKLAKSLDIQEHDPVYEIVRIRLAEEIPMALERTYISANLVQGLTEEIVQNSLYKYIEDTLHMKIASGTQIIEAAIANEQEVKYLDISDKSPIMLMERSSKLDDQTIFEVVKSSYRADRYKFMIDLKRF
ncbi:phosphonate metabolism transcriptional regulator PhnF [Salipaludibacillus neizhouensis]|uniref:Phosphonate metabolism transcriptional regulator PhnF n=1 Tax=Salipaludibacillus neizhouensis TaxID=885475 RepID=A0A3A9KBJ7_9BACI|nr:GntR family transcriptional regulator [Salipaludibacillus neizhouensis]RKL66953.1 phosphonate metabolism transcriptional regulator PhnF [Salipaludibacillus neizhouensis]